MPDARRRFDGSVVLVVDDLDEIQGRKGHPDTPVLRDRIQQERDTAIRRAERVEHDERLIIHDNGVIREYVLDDGEHGEPSVSGVPVEPSVGIEAKAS